MLATALGLPLLWPALEVTRGGEQLSVQFVRLTAFTGQENAAVMDTNATPPRRWNRLQSPHVKATFLVSNATHRPMVGRAGPTEIPINGCWSWGCMYWYPPSGSPIPPSDHVLADFDLQPGQTTNVQLLVAPRGPYRVPFAWGCPSRTPTELLRRRVARFVEHRKKYGSWDGWRSAGPIIWRTSIWESVGLGIGGPGAEPKDGSTTASGNSDVPVTGPQQ